MRNVLCTAYCVLLIAALVTLPGCVSRATIGPIKEDGSQEITHWGTPSFLKTDNVEDLALWNVYLTNYGFDFSKWMTLSEYRAAYPPESRN